MITNEMKTGIELIAEERERQYKVEGWNEPHDDTHDNGSLAMAAVSYATPDDKRFCAAHNIPTTWPWNIKWWKPTPDDRIKELVKAGALIAAEIDRLQRESSIAIPTNKTK